MPIGPPSAVGSAAAPRPSDLEARFVRAMEASVFTYGSLMFPAVVRELTGRVFSSCPGWVVGYERFRVRAEIHPGLVETCGRSTHGRVYFAVDPDTLARLDRFEGGLYERRSVEVGTCGGRRVQAQAWIVPAPHAGFLDRRPWDPEGFRRRELPAYLRACRAFRREDRRRFRR